MAEKRITRRLPFRKRVKIGEDMPTFMGYATNLSENGVGVEARRIYPRGTKVSLYIDDGVVLPDSTMLVTLNGIVSWSKRQLPGRPSKMGIRLVGNENLIKNLYDERINSYKLDRKAVAQ